MPERVLVAMSGGVDSSVAAAELKRGGYAVVGVTLHLWDYPDDGDVKGRCCAPEDVHDARRVADALGFPHFAFDRKELFEREVVGPFVESYSQGETPSPCVRCNRGVKMRELFQLADKLGADTVATGHYARIERSHSGPVLCRALDRNKDQSYFLHMLPPAALGRMRFPLGDAKKEDVRRTALELQLPGATKGESQELCFVPSGRYEAFVRERAPTAVKPGPVLDEDGRVIGQHRGLHGYTVGQRRHLNIATGRRSYVVAMDAAANTIRLGPREGLECDGALVDEVTLRGELSLPLHCQVQVRYRGRPTPAEVLPAGLHHGQTRVKVRFVEPVLAVAKGQYAVFYAGDRVLGGGVIAQALPRGESRSTA